MKRWKKILLIILLALVIAAAALYVWQRKNIALLRTASQYTQEELQEQITGHQQQLQEAIDSHTELTVRDLTDEEKDALREGTISTDELIGLMTGPTEPAAPSDEQSAEAGQSGETQPAENEPTYEQQLSALVAQAYILRETFQNRLEEFEAEAKAEYKELPKGERTKTKLVNIAFSYFDRMVALEDECDAAMNELVAEMRTLITENNGDMSIADTMWQTYEKEKELKKAWYLSQLEQRGI